MEALAPSCAGADVSTTISIGIKELPKALESLELAVRAAITRGLKSGAHRGQARLISKSPVDLGELKASWKIYPRGDGWVLQNTAPHTGIVEHGARPHGVNQAGQEALAGWVRRHFPMLDQKAQDGVLWGIINKLKTRGQKPTYFVRNELEALAKDSQREVEHELRRLKPPRGR